MWRICDVYVMALTVYMWWCIRCCVSGTWRVCVRACVCKCVLALLPFAGRTTVHIYHLPVYPTEHQDQQPRFNPQPYHHAYEQMFPHQQRLEHEQQQQQQQQLILSEDSLARSPSVTSNQQGRQFGLKSHQYVRYLLMLVSLRPVPFIRNLKTQPH